jgi:hypothetical protein
MKNKVKLILVSLLFISTSIFAGETPKPESKSTKEEPGTAGRKVNTTVFHAPASSKEVLKGKGVSYKISYDKTKWGILDEQLNEATEYSLAYNDENAFIMIIPEAEEIEIETYRDVVLENANKALKNVVILNEEERTVNNAKLLMLNIRGEAEGQSIVYIYYIYSGENKSIQAVAFTSEELFPEYKQEMENFLNGLEINIPEVKKK